MRRAALTRTMVGMALNPTDSASASTRGSITSSPPPAPPSGIVPPPLPLDEAGDPGVVPARMTSTRLVGRSAQLAELESTLLDVAAGRPSLTFVVGERLAPRITACLPLVGARGSGQDAVVVEPQQLDYVADVRLALDAPCARPLRIRKDRVGHYPVLFDQLDPDPLGEREMGGVIAVQVADLPATDLEGEFAAAAWP